MKKIAILTTAALLFAIGIGLVVADQDAQANVGVTGQYSPTNANAVVSQGGNVTAVNLTSDASTAKWQGFWGNISGNLQLGDGTDIFYNWTGATFQAVYATLDVNADFATLTDINSTSAVTLANKDTDFGFTGSDVDSIQNTFAGDACSAGTYFSFASGVAAYNSTGGAGNWTTCIGEDAGGALDDSMFGTQVITAGADGYNGQNIQYQLMVPVIAATDNYFFFLEP